MLNEMIACPVCTLFLRPGMNLGEHLETHPKEQVIKALVNLATNSLVNPPVSQHHPSFLPVFGVQDCRTPTGGVLVPAPPPGATTLDGVGHSTHSRRSNGFLNTASHTSLFPPVTVGSNAPEQFATNQVPTANVMVFKRQSTTAVFHGPSSQQQNSAANGNIFMQPPVLVNNSNAEMQVFEISQQHAVKNYQNLPPPPTYGTAINQLRSQSQHIEQEHDSEHQKNPDDHNKRKMTPSVRKMMRESLQHASSETNLTPDCYEIEEDIPRTVSCPPVCQYNDIKLSDSSIGSKTSLSVLRFGDGPIQAEYIESEQGNFIIQEPPIHVVDCMENEEDDDDCSVVEKIIPSQNALIGFREDVCENRSAEPKTENVGQSQESIETMDGEKGNVTSNSGSSVTVISNVKLDPAETYDFMETLSVSQKSRQPENAGVCQNDNRETEIFPIMLTVSRKDSSYGKENEMDMEEELSNKDVRLKSHASAKPSASPSATTSVIRLAANASSSDPNYSEKAGQPKSGSPKATKDKQIKNRATSIKLQPQQNRRWQYKAPKKLVLKTKAKNSNGQRINDVNAVAGSSKSCSSSHHLRSHKKNENSAQEQNNDNRSICMKVEENCKLDKSAVGEQDKENDTLEENNSNGQIQPQHTPVTLESDPTVEITKEEEQIVSSFPIVSSLKTVKDKSDQSCCIVDSPFTAMNLDVRPISPMIVHESSLAEENLGTGSEKSSLALGTSSSSFMQNGWQPKMSGIERLPSGVISEAEKSSSLHSSQFNEICSEMDSHRNDSSTTFNSFPSTSSFSKPSSSSFALQTDYTHAANSSYNDYPFSLLYANEEQPWVRSNIQSVFHQGQNSQQADFSTGPDMDYERSSYIDLDSCKKGLNNSMEALTDELNIRTDEKMPAKGEISEQESNGEMDNVWNQTLFQEPVGRLATFENYMTRESWLLSNDEVSPEDLSAKFKNSSIIVKVEGNVPPETTTADRNPVGRPKTKKPKSTTSQKLFRCPHCISTFTLLKFRNSHMIREHGYKRVNRRLTRESPTSTITSGEAAAAAVTTAVAAATAPTDLQLIAAEAGGTVDDPQSSLDIKPPVIMETADKKNVSVLLATVERTENVRTKYDSIRAGVYRMLMNFNVSVLNQNLKIEDDKPLIDSSSFSCYTCKRDFISVKLFDEHLAEHPAECFTCGRKFTRWTYFSIHLKRHLGWKDFSCTVCEKKFVLRSAMIEHMRKHTGTAPLKCNLCDKSFKRHSNLAQHKRCCHRASLPRRKEYVCFCGEVSPSKARYLWHKEVHDTKPKCCPHCRDRFIHMNSLKRHIRLIHSEKYSFNQPIECPICNQVYAKASLKSHMSTHSMESQHECPICNKAFSTKWNLKIHSWVHANRAAKPFKCEMCTKAFIRQADFQNHINSHKQIKPFTCEYCGCKFIRKYNYMRHRREHHGDKKFNCDLCGKQFHRHYYLIEHRRTHTGERPFLCTICGKSSTTKTNHNKHLKIHHSRDPFTSEV